MRDREREVQRERCRERGAEREGQREKQAPCKKPYVGLDPGSLGPPPELKAVLNR